MAHPLPFLSLLMAVVIVMAGTGCITSGSSAPRDLPPEKLDQIVGSYNYNGTAWIVMNPVGDHAIGDRFVVTAKTDLPAGETVRVRTWPVSFARADKYQINNGSSQNATVTGGSSGINGISVVIDTTDFREAAYVISMESVTAKNVPAGASAAGWYTMKAKPG